ncbi:hypothetical protein ASD88_00690 [Pelomonas sp. Root662]|nr:hypothetical protein ASC81_00690 [Pelomonas sp. Root405]KRA77438.1 hypothetical protein ASD88_00690 [Pelomonas sp. Root662]
MPAATIGAGGVINLPPQVLNVLKLRDGDRIQIVILGDGECLLVPVNRSVTELRSMFGNAA